VVAVSLNVVLIKAGNARSTGIRMNL
jgi:hypothetical protein